MERLTDIVFDGLLVTLAVLLSPLWLPGYLVLALVRWAQRMDRLL